MLIACRFLCLCPALIVLFVAGGIHAAGGATHSFTVRQWTTDDGLPANQINSVVQGREGFLWLATYAGLVRFDGYNFEIFTAGERGLSSNRFTEAAIDLSGKLWLGTQDGQVFRRIGDQFEEVAGPWPMGSVRDIIQDSSGQMWVSHASGEQTPVFRLNEKGRVPVNPKLNGQEIEWSQIGWIKLTRDAHGDVWGRIAGAIPSSGGVGKHAQIRLRDNTANPYGEPAPLGFEGGSSTFFTRPNTDFTDVLDSDGRLLAGIPGDGQGNIWLQSALGDLWVSRGRALQAYRPGETTPSFAVELPDHPIHVMEDREGNIWVTSRAGGLHRLSPSAFHARVSDQTTWILSVFEGERGVPEIQLWSRPCPAEFVDPRNPDSRIQASCELSLRDRRLTSWRTDGAQVRGTTTGGQEIVLPYYARRLEEDPVEDGILWTIERRNRRPATVTKIDPYADAGQQVVASFGIGLEGDLIWSRDGSLWVPHTLGLTRIVNDQAELFDVSDGLPVPHIRTVFEDSDGTLWVGTYGGGLARYQNGHFQTVRRSDGLVEDFVSSILEDDDGNLWMAGNSGIQRVRRADLNAFLDGRLDHVEAVGYSDRLGVPDPATTGQRSLRTADGWMWFATVSGLVAFHPRQVIELEGTPPRVHILTAQEASLPEVVQLPGSDRRLSVEYVAISLRSPEKVRYAYRMSGLESAWTSAGTDRRGRYSYLPPGSYEFQVRARSAAGVWSLEPAGLRIEVPPLFYETRLFYALCGLALALGSVGVFRYRTGLLKARQRELEQSVHDRTQKLREEKRIVERQAEQLEDLYRSQARFFSSISHEFRTPLTLIQGPLEDLEKGLYGSLSPDVEEMVGLAGRNSRRLNRLVDQLLDVMRAESRSLQLKARRTDIGSFLKGVAEPFQSLAERRGISYIVQLPAQPVDVWIDPGHFEKVVTNILGNAFKFTPNGGTVELKTEQSKIEGLDWFAIRIGDDGPGIPKEELPRIFDRFYQGEEMQRAQPGTGIGLSLARELTLLHHGVIDVDSRPGEGSVFSIRLRLGHEHFRSEEIAPEADGEDREVAAVDVGSLSADVDSIPLSDGAPTQPRLEEGDVARILIADDSPEIRSYLRRHFAPYFHVLEAVDGEQALEMTRRLLPDLVVSDVMMPRLDGFELCARLKEDPETDFIPVLLLTAKASMDSRIEGLEGGADDYLSKPFHTRELEVRVHNLIHSRRKLKERFGNASRTGTDLRAAEGGVQVLIAPTGANFQPADEAFLERTREVVEAELGNEDFSIDDLATKSGHSRATLFRRFKDLLQMSPAEFIFTVRLEHAAALLNQRAGSVSEIAYAVGFRSVAHFSTRFKDRFGESPSKFRG